jgi:hypothetical protein
MYIKSGTIAAIGVVLSVSVLSGCSSDARGDTPAAPVENSVVERAPAYVGDPWEKRYRGQFWADQHIHDSWNKCHIGENVPPRLQQGDDCWSRLRSDTGR